MNYFDAYLIEKTNERFELLDSEYIIESGGGLFKGILNAISRLIERIKKFLFGRKQEKMDTDTEPVPDNPEVTKIIKAKKSRLAKITKYLLATGVSIGAGFAAFKIYKNKIKSKRTTQASSDKSLDAEPRLLIGMNPEVMTAEQKHYFDVLDKENGRLRVIMKEVNDLQLDMDIQRAVAKGESLSKFRITGPESPRELKIKSMSESQKNELASLAEKYSDLLIKARDDLGKALYDLDFRREGIDSFGGGEEGLKKFTDAAAISARACIDVIQYDTNDILKLAA